MPLAGRIDPIASSDQPSSQAVRRPMCRQKIGRNILESLGRVAVGHAAGLNRGIPSSEHIDGGVPNHPCSVTMALCVRQYLENSDRVGFLMIKAITAVDGDEMLVDSKTIQHRAAEVNRFVCQDCQLAVHEPVERFTDAGIQRRVVQHVRAIVRQKHLQARLDVRFRGFRSKRPPDQHQRAIADKTSNFVLRQNRQIELMTNMIYGCREVFFRIH